MNTCKGICDNMKIQGLTKSYQVGYKVMGEGWKKCKTCCISIKEKDLRCPCCRRKLSTYIKYKNSYWVKAKNGNRYRKIRA